MCDNRKLWQLWDFITAISTDFTELSQESLSEGIMKHKA